QPIITTVASNTPARRSVMPLLRVLFGGLGWWTIPLDKGLFEAIPGVDSSWGESIHPSLCASSKSKWEDTQHDRVVRNSGNVKKSNNAEDPIYVIVSILVLVPREGVFPQFSHELTLDFEIDVASNFMFNHAWCLVVS
ncbi:hypothetical protein Tco_1539195, partial [Tanacetum coccineum]